MDGGQLPFDCLNVTDDPVPRAGALNMAIDELLLTRLQNRALLRLYRWNEPTVSLGCFGMFGEAKQLAGDRRVVRRWTGGGIVEHGDDLTYSLIVPRSSRFATLRAMESYRAIHDTVARALQRCGFRTETVGSSPGGRPADSHGHACFENPVSHDLLADGRKVAGGAQRRTRDGLLHQGSIRPAAGDGDWSVKLGGELAMAFGSTLTTRPLARDELAAAGELAAAKYATSRWLEKF